MQNTKLTNINSNMTQQSHLQTKQYTGILRIVRIIDPVTSTLNEISRSNTIQ